MDTVIITTYNRPDYLRLCLEYLSRAQGIETKDIRLYVDRGSSLKREFYEVVNDFQNILHVVVTFRPEHAYMGNSMNTLEAYKEAYQTDSEFIYLVEDDVLVQPDFFTWHEAVQSRGDFMASIGYRCIRNSKREAGISDPAAYFTSRRDYASVGVCWRREKLQPVVKHARPEYYGDLGGYLERNFPNNRFADSFSEQDGLIMRVLGETHGNIAWSYVPRCYHIGFAGYNRPRGPRLSYEEIRQTIHNQEKVKAADRDFGDIEVVPTRAVPDWNPCDMYELQHFE